MDWDSVRPEWSDLRAELLDTSNAACDSAIHLWCAETVGDEEPNGGSLVVSRGSPGSPVRPHPRGVITAGNERRHQHKRA